MNQNAPFRRFGLCLAAMIAIAGFSLPSFLLEVAWGDNATTLPSASPASQPTGKDISLGRPDNAAQSRTTHPCANASASDNLQTASDQAVLAEFIKRRNKLLTQVDEQLIKGLRQLREQYGQLKTSSGWETNISQDGLVFIRLSNRDRDSYQKGERTRKQEDVNVNIAIHDANLRLSDPQHEEYLSKSMSIGFTNLYLNLGLWGYIHTSAGDPKLDAAIKALVADALKPLAELEASSRPITTQPATQPAGTDVSAGQDRTIGQSSSARPSVTTSISDTSLPVSDKVVMAEFLKRRNKLLAQVYEQLIKGLRQLREQYGQLKTASGWETNISQDELVFIRLSNWDRQSYQKGERPRKQEEVYVSILIQSLNLNMPEAQLKEYSLKMGGAFLTSLYPNLGLWGYIQTNAGDPKLDAAIKAMVADALKPLAELNASIRPATTQPATQPVAASR